MVRWVYVSLLVSSFFPGLLGHRALNTSKYVVVVLIQPIVSHLQDIVRSAIGAGQILSLKSDSPRSRKNHLSTFLHGLLHTVVRLAAHRCRRSTQQ